MREENMDRLNDAIERLGGADAHPGVSIDLFLAGNDDPASIGPNLEPHPGVRAFERVLKDIRDRQEVSDVVVQIDEVIEGEWPFRFSGVRDHRGYAGGGPPMGRRAPARRVRGRSGRDRTLAGRRQATRSAGRARGPPRCHALLGQGGTLTTVAVEIYYCPT